MNNDLKDMLIWCSMLLSPVMLAFAVCFVRGVRAEIRERKERRVCRGHHCI